MTDNLQRLIENTVHKFCQSKLYYYPKINVIKDMIRILRVIGKKRIGKKTNIISVVSEKSAAIYPLFQLCFIKNDIKLLSEFFQLSKMNRHIISEKPRGNKQPGNTSPGKSEGEYDESHTAGKRPDTDP